MGKSDIQKPKYPCLGERPGSGAPSQAARGLEPFIVPGAGEPEGGFVAGDGFSITSRVAAAVEDLKSATVARAYNWVLDKRPHETREWPPQAPGESWRDYFLRNGPFFSDKFRAVSGEGTRVSLAPRTPGILVWDPSTSPTDTHFVTINEYRVFYSGKAVMSGLVLWSGTSIKFHICETDDVDRAVKHLIHGLQK